jgi:hypothetical protein
MIFAGLARAFATQRVVNSSRSNSSSGTSPFRRQKSISAATSAFVEPSTTVWELNLSNERASARRMVQFDGKRPNLTSSGVCRYTPGSDFVAAYEIAAQSSI